MSLTENHSEEGYIKYRLMWEKDKTLLSPLLAELNDCRNRLYDMGLIGAYTDSGIGFGNISCRMPAPLGLFAISGTQTGHIAQLTSAHYTTVTAYDLADNRVCCRGPVKASSEALTHAALYDLSALCGAVIHVHHRQWWEQLLGNVPTTERGVSYGTPDMAREMARLYNNSTLPQQKILAMAGHTEGIIVFDNTCALAISRLLYYWQKSGF